MEASEAKGEEFVRLHITPLDAELFKIVISAAAQTVARNVSYHTIETFPEKRYGFVELPEKEAEKLKKKLHGTTLRGTKMRIEKARPETIAEPTGESMPKEKKGKKKSEAGASDEKEGSKKRKREVNVMDGVALKDRKVKRGWTEAPADYKTKSRKDKKSKDEEKQKRKRPKSKYTEGEECLLKTKVPLNAMSNLAPEDLPARKKKKGNKREVIVHEFEKTTKFPSFLKNAPTTDIKTAAEFVEGKGWVDEQGNLVEEVKEPKLLEKKKVKVKVLEPEPEPMVEDEDEDDGTSSSGTSSDGTSDDSDSDSDSGSESQDVKGDAVPEVKTPQKITDQKANRQSESDTSSEDDSDSDTSSSGSEDESPSKAIIHTTEKSATKPSPKLAIKIPPPETPSSHKVHPLEALYKRPKPDGEALQTPGGKASEPFSFFGGGGDDDGDDGKPSIPHISIPMTPFTRQDYESRNSRSAAPTPDTAHPSRMHHFFPDVTSNGGTALENDIEEEEEEEEDGDHGAEDVEEEEEEEEEEGDGAGQDAGPGKEPGAGSDFQKWFWENRRDLNRSWMNRRKTTAKEKRHRENKARASKAV